MKSDCIIHMESIVAPRNGQLGQFPLGWPYLIGGDHHIVRVAGCMARKVKGKNKSGNSYSYSATEQKLVRTPLSGYWWHH